MPGGSVLRVEPSDPYHKVTAKTSKSNSRTENQQQTELSIDTQSGRNLGAIHDEIARNSAKKQPEKSAGGADEEEDLDVFFASLE